MIENKGIGNRIADVIIYILLGVAALACILPILNTLAVSLSDKAAAEGGMVNFWPVNFTLDSYIQIVKDKQFIHSMSVSLVRVVLGVGLNFIMMVLAAFPLSRSSKSFPGRNVYMWIMIVVMLFPGSLIPTYMVISKLHLLDTIWALVLPTAVPIWNIIVLMNFFKSLPPELEEACIVDGGGPWDILIKIFIPLSMPSIATVILFCVVGHWNSFFDGLIYMNDPWNYPLQSYIYKLQVATNVSNLSNMTPEEMKRVMAVSNKTFNAAKIFVTMIPVLAAYPFMQRYFVTGIVLGSVKG